MSPGTNAGTGQPISFRCAKCRYAMSWARRHRERGSSLMWKGYRDRIQLTGRTRPGPPNRGGVRMTTMAREYRCLDCGHVGWSRHVDLARMS